MPTPIPQRAYREAADVLRIEARRVQALAASQLNLAGSAPLPEVAGELLSQAQVTDRLGRRLARVVALLEGHAQQPTGA